MASMKGADSMSPTVPPSYNAQRGGRMKRYQVDLIWIYIPRQCTRLVVHQIHLQGFWRRAQPNLGLNLLHGERSVTYFILASWPRTFWAE